MKLENFSFLPSFVGVPVICLLFGVLCCLIKRSILLNRLCVLILLQNAGSHFCFSLGNCFFYFQFILCSFGSSHLCFRLGNCFFQFTLCSFGNTNSCLCFQFEIWFQFEYCVALLVLFFIGFFLCVLLFKCFYNFLLSLLYILYFFRSVILLRCFV